MLKLARSLAAALVFGRRARLDCFAMVADLLEAECSLERALEIAAGAARDEGRRGRAWVLGRWRRALPEDRFAETAARWLPGSEAMIFEAYGRVEASKGELGFFLVSDGGVSPYRCKIRSPSLINLTITEHLLVGWKLADMIVSLGSVDINMGEVDR